MLAVLVVVAVIAGVVFVAVHSKGGDEPGSTAKGKGAGARTEQPSKDAPTLLRYDPIGFTNTCEYASAENVSAIVGRRFRAMYDDHYPACQLYAEDNPHSIVVTGVYDLRGGGLYDTINRVKSNLDPTVVDASRCPTAEGVARHCTPATAVSGLGDGALLVTGTAEGGEPRVALWVRRNGVALHVAWFVGDRPRGDALERIAKVMLTHVPAPPAHAIAPPYVACSLLGVPVRTIILGSPGESADVATSNGSPSFPGQCSFQVRGTNHAKIRVEVWATVGSSTSLHEAARTAAGTGTRLESEAVAAGKIAPLEGVGDEALLVVLGGGPPHPFVLACGMVFAVSVETSAAFQDEPKSTAAAKVIASEICHH